jgi:hypothetical protein
LTETSESAKTFNKNLTATVMEEVHHIMARAITLSFAGFLREFPRLKYIFRDLAQGHYSLDIFTRDGAKKQFLEPDLQPFGQNYLNKWEQMRQSLPTGQLVLHDGFLLRKSAHRMGPLFGI